MHTSKSRQSLWPGALSTTGSLTSSASMACAGSYLSGFHESLSCIDLPVTSSLETFSQGSHYSEQQTIDPLLGSRIDNPIIYRYPT